MRRLERSNFSGKDLDREKRYTHLVRGLGRGCAVGLVPRERESLHACSSGKPE